jgi:hypothetical protein
VIGLSARIALPMWAAFSAAAFWRIRGRQCEVDKPEWALCAAFHNANVEEF